MDCLMLTFKDLKYYMVSIPMLEIYNNSVGTQVEVYTNARAKALGAVPPQKYAATKHFCPIEYYGKKFNNA